MQLSDGFESWGKWLFRWRSYLPFLFLIPLSVAIRNCDHDGTHLWSDTIWPLVCLSISIVGLAIRLHCIGHAAPRTSGRNTKEQVADSLNTTGLYSIARHPLYLANFLIALGIVAQPNNWWLTCLYCAAFALYYERIMFTEEAFLQRKFGDEYRNWAKQTPTFFPRMTRYRRATRRMNVAKVFRNEGAAVAVITIAFTVMEIAEHARTNIASLEPWWPAFGVVGALLYIGSRVYKRQTWKRVQFA